jgi:CRISPR-associated endonuclease Csn1
MPSNIKKKPDNPLMKTIWSFDLGIASIGEAVRNLGDDSFPHKDSLLIPEDFAETATARGRRRMKRTREAHKAREEWLDAVWQAAGLEPLVGRRVALKDGVWGLEEVTPAHKENAIRLQREFPKKGDGVCYNSALLRIKLLRGDTKLEPWQIYKALRASIQRRGYGPVPWANRDVGKKELSLEEAEKEQKKQDEELAKKDPDYRHTLEAWSKFKDSVARSFQSPCYYDAFKMGLWNPSVPDEFSERVTCLAGSTKRVRFDRNDVEREIENLARNAAIQLPQLGRLFLKIKECGWRAEKQGGGTQKIFPVFASDFGEFFVHGPAGAKTLAARGDFAAHLAFLKGRGIHPGGNEEWMGATAQKTPRFDNRIINQCALLEGLQVCGVTVRRDREGNKPDPDSLLHAEVTFLMKLKNILVHGPGGQRKLTAQEIADIFQAVSKKAAAKDAGLKNYSSSVIQSFSMTASAWFKASGIKNLALVPLPGHEVVRAPKTEGRSRFSRPALRILRALILAGEKPSVFHGRLVARDPELLNQIGMDILDEEPVRTANGAKNFTKRPRPWVLTSQLKFLAGLARANDTWEGIYIPEQRLDSLEARHADAEGNVARGAAIRELIGSVNDPVVRHRLGVFAGRLAALEAEFGKPEEIVMEFVRTDFMGKDAKAQLAAFQKKREEARKAAIEQVGKTDAIKYELAAAQGCACIYCGMGTAMTKLDALEVEHIVPRSQGGPDAMVNYALACKSCNAGKGERTPFQWLRNEPTWGGFEQRVNARATELRNKKVQLLLREDAQELVQRYTSLAETAWISRLAQKIVWLHFGWKNGIDGHGRKRVTIISGGLTGRVRRKYRLNSLLSPCPDGEDPAEWEAKVDVPKNRKDSRHHALDAMVINFLPQWTRDEKKQRFFRFPEKIQANPQGFFESQLQNLIPRNIAFEKPALADTIYGSRRDGGGRVIVQRVALLSLGMKSAGPSKVAFDGKYLAAKAKTIREPAIATEVGRFLSGANLNEGAWRRFCDELHLPRKDGSRGARVIKVNVNAGSPTEYIDLSKDRSGAYRKGKKGHRGQIVYLLPKKDRSGAVKMIACVRPVYAFESKHQAECSLKKEHGEVEILGFFQSGCLVSTNKEIQHSRLTLPPASYLLNTIRADGYAQLTNERGQTYPEIPLYSISNLVEAGIRRLK